MINIFYDNSVKLHICYIPDSNQFSYLVYENDKGMAAISFR